jgi:putative pyruvate formate lyase activating enzyme
MDATRREFVLESLAFPMMRRKDWKPAYLSLSPGELSQRARALEKIQEACHLCPRACGVNRRKGKTGVCGLPARLKIASAHPHYGEEPELVGRGGSGTIFFSHCNLLCVFCQNYDINHHGRGEWSSAEECAGLMLGLQSRGCENINWVTPTHVVPSLVRAVEAAIPRGFRLPIVYNCGGYEPVEVIRLLEGVVDLYLPDYKYTDSSTAARLSNGASDYPEAAAAAIKEMHRQVGRLTVDERGAALRGLMIRHLVLPNNRAGTERFVQWVARELGKETYVNIMSQYRPEHRAREFPEISRRITPAEYQQALAWARQAGLSV